MTTLAVGAVVGHGTRLPFSFFFSRDRNPLVREDVGRSSRKLSHASKPGSLLSVELSPPSPHRRHYRACRQRCLEPMALPKAGCTAPFFVFCETGPPSNLGHVVLPSTLRQPPPEVLLAPPLDPSRHP
ncbi:hypothetical protein LR48_Vigan03g111400 [Vigna angularis]|uniref:Uncharacterized protein n=1 Tax=Phaseolus angularis TaxID=3914 RepID=A0A0L9U4X8_PHAAN|nr:hypothetical protein LR48_Vigan03g111400 [Vigna angularis]